VLKTPEPAAAAGGRHRSAAGTFWIAFVLIAALATLWALASPIFSVPDENAHAAKAIAQVRGELVGHRVPGVRQLVVDLPPSYAFSPQIQCFVYHPDRPANCGVELGDKTGTDWASTWVSTYNPIYYYVVGWPSLMFGGSAGIYAMRIVSALLGALFLAWAFQMSVASARARWMPVGVAFAAAPMVLYLNGAINPNGVEIAAAVAMWVTLLRLLERFSVNEPDRSPQLPTVYLWSIVTVSAIVLGNARALGPLWVVVVLAGCILVSGVKPARKLFATRSSYWWIGGIAVGGLFSLLWTLGSGSLSGQAEKADAPLVGASFVAGFAYMLRSTVSFFKQAFGYFGWFDAPLPDYGFWPIVAAIVILLVLGFAATGRRGALILAGFSVAAVVIPALVQAYSVHQTGIIWQGRYGLFLYLAIPVMAAWLLSGPAGERLNFLSSRITWAVTALLWLYSIGAFFFVMRRYVIGNATPIGSMWKDPQWQPPLGWITLVVLFALVSAGFFTWIGRLGMQAARRDDESRLGVVTRTDPVLDSSRA
jgi:hypothetical protein